MPVMGRNKHWDWEGLIFKDKVLSMKFNARKIILQYPKRDSEYVPRWPDANNPKKREYCFD